MPQRFIVRVETRKIWATSETVSKSGRLFKSRFFFIFSVWVVSKLLSIDIQITRNAMVSQYEFSRDAWKWCDRDFLW